MTTKNLTTMERQILEYIDESGPCYPAQYFEHQDRAKTRPTIYTRMSRLEEKGYLSYSFTEAPEGSHGPARKIYSLTKLGESLLNE